MDQIYKFIWFERVPFPLGNAKKKLFYSIYLTCHNLYFWGSTLPETNVAPETRPCQNETSIPTIHFQGRKC